MGVGWWTRRRADGCDESPAVGSSGRTIRQAANYRNSRRSEPACVQRVCIPPFTLRPLQVNGTDVLDMRKVMRWL